MRTLHAISDRLVTLFVPQVEAGASNCWWDYLHVDGTCYKRWCCLYTSGTRCNGYVGC
ncbi:hypothetical protein ABZ297_45025 [Nonomuraea sp. NPDC005983]|uniref:hypothetical protein n=1 Tax=Nonomuraea sp. NPDC005983 TaxID=3155595 RepID=UPI0033AB7711